MCRNRLITLLFLCGCTTSRLTLEPIQQEALISALNTETGEVDSELGRGAIVLEGDQVRGRGYVISLAEHEDTLLYIAGGADDEKLQIRLKPIDSGVAGELSKLRAELDAARQTAAEAQRELGKQRDYYNTIVEPLAQAQHFLTLQSTENASLALQQIEKAGEQSQIPAYALFLKAKISIAEGNIEEAKRSLEEALRKQPGLLSARQMLEALN